jgi:hypothetical protein
MSPQPFSTVTASFEEEEKFLNTENLCELPNFPPLAKLLEIVIHKFLFPNHHLRVSPQLILVRISFPPFHRDFPMLVKNRWHEVKSSPHF